MLTTHAVGIDLGTTYSCISYLNEHGEPVTLPNQEGELSTPSVVMIDDGKPIVGTEALRNAILHPSKVIQNSKRFIGDATPRWTIDGKPYTPVDVASLILKKLIAAAQERIGTIEQAVITVPAQFSDAQRHAVIDAGHRAGLQKVDIINEPVAAALCHVLGTEGMWFTELADEQRILVYDLGGGTFDLSLVSYKKNEVSVISTSGDLHLGGIEWNRAMLDYIAKQFAKEFKVDPREDPSSYQALANEVELTKRSLSVRPKAALTCQHAGERKTFQVTVEQFEKLTSRLVKRTGDITVKMLKDKKMGWAHVDVVLLTGGSSRMPMVRNHMKKLSGRTMNTSLSPEQSIAHGATYFAGMLLTNNKFAKSILNKQAKNRLGAIKQKSVNARSLGIVVRDPDTDRRIAHYLIPDNTSLPVAATKKFGTVVENQKRIHLQIIESGLSNEDEFVKLGDCVIDKLPPNTPEGSEVSVKIIYDDQAKVHVTALDVRSGRHASSTIIRADGQKPQLSSDQHRESDVKELPQKKVTKKPTKSMAPVDSQIIETANQPIPLCNKCGAPLSIKGACPTCGPKKRKKTASSQKKRAGKRSTGKKQSRKTSTDKPDVAGEDEFWKMVDVD